MKNKWKDWFLNYIEDKEFITEDYPFYDVKRNYQICNIEPSDVPFHEEFVNTLKNLTGAEDFAIEQYHIHKWSKGNYFTEHIDDRDSRIFAYVCELKESDCKTKLLVNREPKDEAWFDVQTKHEVPKIKEGTRISLTVFGKYGKKYISSLT